MTKNKLYQEKAARREKENTLQPFDRIVSYFRDSGGDGQDRSVDSQKHDLQTECRRLNLVVHKIFEDRSKSGTTTRSRRQFTAMMQYFDTGQARHDGVRGLLILNFGRFARDENDAQYFISNLRRQGFLVKSVTDNIPEGDFSNVVETFTHFSNAQFSRDLSKNVMRGQRFVLNNYHQEGNDGLYRLPDTGELVQLTGGGFPPVGYESHKVLTGHNRRGTARYNSYWKKTSDPDLAARVRQAWEMALAASSYPQIEEACKLGVTKWGYSDFFRTETYTGVYQYGAFRRENAFEAYVTREEFDKLQVYLEERKAGLVKLKKPSMHRYLLSGLVRCGACGDPVHGTSIRSADQRQHFYYECASRGKGRACEMGRYKLRAEVLEGEVLKTIVAQLDPVFVVPIIEELTNIRRENKIRPLSSNINLETVIEGEVKKIKGLSLQLATGDAQKLGIEGEVRELLKEAVARRDDAQDALIRSRQRDNLRFEVDMDESTDRINDARSVLQKIVDCGEPSGSYPADDQDITDAKALLEALAVKIILQADFGKDKRTDGEGGGGLGYSSRGWSEGYASIRMNLGFLCTNVGTPMKEKKPGDIAELNFLSTTVGTPKGTTTLDLKFKAVIPNVRTHKRKVKK